MVKRIATINDVRLVPGEPKIEQVAKRWGPKFDLKLKNYEVFVGDVLIGRVEQHLPTFERKPKGFADRQQPVEDGSPTLDIYVTVREARGLL
jgi:hypothetical protein